jgi:Rnl2 family RNA ligase
MEFTKYSSIENHYRDGWIEKIKNNVHPSTQFVVLEKIHGANFSFVTDGIDIRVAKRTSIIAKDDNFFGAPQIFERYKNDVIDLFFNIYSENKDEEVQQIQVYGEIFGGSYNGEKTKESTLVQKEVQYIPFNDYMVFDIKIIYNDGSEFMNYLDVKRLCEHSNLKIVPEIFIGTFDECLIQDNEYLTKVPSYYDLESIEGNVCEGNVIKPIDSNLFIGSDRVIVKHKNDKFKEKGKVKTKNKNINITEKERMWVGEITKYFEPTRLEALFSKGDVKSNMNEFGKISGLFFKDVMDDFIADNKEFLELDKKIRKFIQNLAQNECRLYVRDLLFKDESK